MYTKREVATSVLPPKRAADQVELEEAPEAPVQSADDQKYCCDDVDEFSLIFPFG